MVYIFKWWQTRLGVSIMQRKRNQVGFDGTCLHQIQPDSFLGLLDCQYNTLTLAYHPNHVCQQFETAYQLVLQSRQTPSINIHLNLPPSSPFRPSTSFLYTTPTSTGPQLMKTTMLAESSGFSIPPVSRPVSDRYLIFSSY